ncbi:hypothetical protein Gorai_009123 [Gossypium raimondii]|uniref:DUF4283 domain-containing protein n=1 Tax=Gossypium raimondii TaxID=29730 RepID=A0A7J8PSN8_GOSRA|nr:hypothetical protein [Gossypium raimondii]
MSNSLCGDNGDGSCSVGDRNTKKKEKLFGKRLHDQKGGVKWLVLKRMMILLFLDGDIKRFAALQNQINGLRKPSMSSQLMDIENGYFLMKFQNSEDYETVLTQGPWIIYGHLYKKRILWEISGMVGKIAKLDFNTDSKARGKYARMAVYVNLGKPLLSQAKEVVTTPVGKDLTADMAMADAGPNPVAQDTDSQLQSVSAKAAISPDVSSLNSVGDAIVSVSGVIMHTSLHKGVTTHFISDVLMDSGLNTDGVVLIGSGLANARGVVQDENGNWIFG